MPITHQRLWRVAVLISTLLAAVATPAAAQPGPELDGEASTEADRAGSSRAPETLGEVAIEVRQVGLRKARPGEWCGFQVQLTDSAAKARDVFVRVEIKDPDGDRAVMQRYAVLNPNTKQHVWLYAWLPFGPRDFRFTVHEAEDRAGAIGESGSGGAAGVGGGTIDRYRAGRRIGSLFYTLPSSSAVDSGTSLIAVLGAPTAGLDQYTGVRSTASNDNACPTAHGLTETITGLRPDDLPDRWMGLAQFEALVWTGREAGEQPGNLREPQAEAIREWVRRGGHFIVVLPSIGQTWYGVTAGASGASAALNPLADIMPDVRPKVNEGVPLEPYRQLLTASQTAPMPRNAVVHTFDEPGRAGPYDAIPIMQGESGDTVVVRRLVGAGAVTVIGVDLARRDLMARDALQAGQFWNRILGKRMRVLTQTELASLKSGGTSKNSVPLFAARRDPVNFDSPISTVIAKQSKAAAGLLAAFAVFLAYWLVAGPLGYVVLKQRNRVHHAWLVFVAATALFSLVGWGSSSALKLGRDVDKHYTLLDHVYGQSNPRMRSWVELTLPRYGEQRVSVRPATPGTPEFEGGSGGRWHQAMTAWEGGTETSSALQSFPDARSYTVDARSPDTADFPARSTTRQLQIDFAGAPPASWDMIRPLAADGVELGREIYFEEPPGGTGEGGADRQTADRRWRIQGRLVHNLPGPLRDVHVFVVREMSLRWPQAEAIAVPLPAVVIGGKGPNAWEPGVPLDLEPVIPRSARDTRDFFLNIRGKASAFGTGLTSGALPQNAVTLNRAALAQAFYSMLEPPDPGASAEIWAVRQSTHNWDLGRWFTQPCVIVVGLLGEESGSGAVECPVPISIDGASPEEVRKNVRGMTVVRWIYPLPPRPPRAEPRSPLDEVDPPPGAPAGQPGSPASEKPNEPAQR